MPTPVLWSSVGVTMESAAATADTITGITKANPGVVTATSHGISDGQYVLLDIEGMTELDGKVVRVANGDTNTFELEGVDTTNFGTFSSGTAADLTFGTTISTITTVSASGGDFDFADVTTIHDTIRKQLPTVANAISYQFENIWDISDAGLVALKSASDLKAQKAFKFVFSSGAIMVFSGYVGSINAPGGAAQELVTSPTSITAFGTPTYYSS